jgi:hypothetical protein
MYPTRQCIANKQGDVSIVSISRAITIGTPQEEVSMEQWFCYTRILSYPYWEMKRFLPIFTTAMS